MRAIEITQKNLKVKCDKVTREVKSNFYFRNFNRTFIFRKQNSYRSRIQRLASRVKYSFEANLWTGITDIPCD